MKKIMFNNHTPCPYGLKLSYILKKLNYDDSIYLDGICSNCKHHVKRFKETFESGYVICNHSVFQYKLKLVKDLLE